MTQTPRSLCCTAVLGLALFAAALPAMAADPAWTPLFNGKDLAGWTQKGGQARYEVRDGAIVGTSVPDTPNSFLCTARDYGDFILEYELKVDEALNSGVQIRSHSFPEYQNGRVHGYQIEIDPDVKRGRLWTGGIYDEGRRGWLADLTENEAARKAFKPGEWNHIRVDARGESIKTWVNGVPAADLVDSMDLSGFIALQVHGVKDHKEPLTVAWRDIRIKDLGQSAWLPIWDKASLKGWKATGGTWTIEGGSIVGAVTKADTKRAMLALEKPPLTDFTLRLEYRLTGGSGGVSFRYQAGADGAESGLQAHLEATEPSGSLVNEECKGTMAQVGTEASNKAGKPGEWNLLTVSAHGPRVAIHVNNILTARHDRAMEGEGVLFLGLSPEQDARLEVRGLALLGGPVPPPVAGVPVGWCIRFQGTTPEDARAAGYEYVELAFQDVLALSDSDMEAAVTRVAALGIPALSGYNVIPADLKLVGPEVDTARQDAYLEHALGRAERLGMKIAVLGSPKARQIPEGFARKEATEQLAGFCRRFAAAAQKHGVEVLLEPMPKRDTNLVNTVSEALEVIAAANHPNLHLLVDYSYLVMEKEDPAILLKAGAHVRQVHISNPEGRTYPMGTDPSDYPSFFRALAQIGYRGGLSVHARTDLFAAEAPRAIAFLRGMAADVVAAPPPAGR